MKKKYRKKTRKAIQQMIGLLRAITEGQGSVSVDVFDAGAGGGWVSGKMHIILERDGLLASTESYNSAQDFADGIMSLIEERYNGLTAKIFVDSKWDEE